LAIFTEIWDILYPFGTFYVCLKLFRFGYHSPRKSGIPGYKNILVEQFKIFKEKREGWIRNFFNPETFFLSSLFFAAGLFPQTFWQPRLTSFIYVMFP
jgi:hypothetical protein